MSIECYFNKCPYHGENFGFDGPFCDEVDCHMTDSQLMELGYSMEEIEVGEILEE